MTAKWSTSGTTVVCAIVFRWVWTKEKSFKNVFEEKPRLLPWGRSGEPLGIVLPPILLTITKVRIGRHGRGGPPRSDAREASARSLRGRPESLPTNDRQAIAWPVRERQVRQRGDPQVPR